MKLTRITITGADDDTDPGKLVALSERFPFVEWGMLFSAKREGREPRYPSLGWRSCLVRSSVTRYSLHLCGEASREAMNGAYVFGPWSRVQLNGFPGYISEMDALGREFVFEGPSREFILQCSSQAALARAEVLSQSYPNVSALWDESGGTGKSATIFPFRHALSLGYSGGIQLENVRSVAEWVSSFPGDREFWLDIESGARTDDRFDLRKVAQILETVEPLIVKAG